MRVDVDWLHDAVAREMRLLCDLPAVAPAPSVVARAQAAVRAEALRQRVRARRAARLQAWGGLAAAVLLAVGLITQAPPRTDEPVRDPAIVLSEWAEAWEQSNNQLAALVHEGWTDGGGTGIDTLELEDAFDGLDATFARFEQL